MSIAQWTLQIEFVNKRSVKGMIHRKLFHFIVLYRTNNPEAKFSILSLHHDEKQIQDFRPHANSPRFNKNQTLVFLTFWGRNSKIMTIIKTFTDKKSFKTSIYFKLKYLTQDFWKRVNSPHFCYGIYKCLCTIFTQALYWNKHL